MQILEPSAKRIDSSSLAINKRSDFTRRIPAYPPKVQARVEKIVKQLIHAYDVEGDTEKMRNIFMRKACLLPNPSYWELLRTVWVASGKTENSREFRPLFKSSRPSKSWFMTVEDAAALDAMEFPITVYRAYDPYYDTPEGIEEGGDPGLSWTLDKEWCEGYAASKQRVIKSRQVERKDIFAYVSRRGEEEIIIL
jgi:hypothetical protein